MHNDVKNKKNIHLCKKKSQKNTFMWGVAV